MAFYSWGLPGLGQSRVRCFHEDRKSLPHQEAPVLSVLPDPGLSLSSYSSPRVLVTDSPGLLSLHPRGASVKVNSHLNLTAALRPPAELITL